jgi:hypothetical protein
LTSASVEGPVSAPALPSTPEASGIDPPALESGMTGPPLPPTPPVPPPTPLSSVPPLPPLPPAGGSTNVRSCAPPIN